MSGLVHSAHYVVGGSLAGCSNEWITRILPASTLAPFLFNCTRYTISLIVFGAKLLKGNNFANQNNSKRISS